MPLHIDDDGRASFSDPGDNLVFIGLRRDLRERFSDHAASQRWMERPSQHLNGARPRQLLKDGRVAAVREALVAHCADLRAAENEAQLAARRAA